MTDTSQNDGQGDTEALYAWISTDKDGLEGIIMAPFPNGQVLPLVMADSRRARRMQPIAAVAATARRSTARLVKFTRAETLLEVPPA